MQKIDIVSPNCYRDSSLKFIMLIMDFKSLYEDH